MKDQLESVDALREIIAAHTCNKYNIHAFVIETKKQVMVLCCCKEFTAQLRMDLRPALKEEFSHLNVVFVTGALDFL